jgi:translocation and assembly module TamA
MPRGGWTPMSGLSPGPKLRFGRLEISGEERMREQRIRKIAGLPEGETFSETELRRAETRLRRTGIFSLGRAGRG